MFLKLTSDNCEYRGEGNTGLVICLKKEGKVLRLIKQDGSHKDAGNPQKLLEQMENEVLMITNVMKPLLGKDLINSPVIVALQAEDIKLINSVVNRMRPSSRIHKNVKEEKTYGLLLPDYCTLPAYLKSYSSSGPVLSIEIKPKPGALLTQEVSFHSENSSLLCHFCRKQVYKLKVDGVSPKSFYCPTDLFSGCLKRMQHALKMLLQTPQNNLRIFKDQKLIYSNEKKNDLEEMLIDFFTNSKLNCVDVLMDLVIAVLLKPILCKPEKYAQAVPECDILTCANAHHGCAKNDSCHTLPMDCVLQRILNLQLLEKLDIQTIYSLLNRLREANTESSNSIGCYLRSEIPPHLGEREKAEGESDYEYASRKVWEFIMALVAKDCSIMLVLRKSDAKNSTENANIVTDGIGNQYLFSIAVLDLDTKPLSRIEKHYKRTPLWIQACSNLLDDAV